MPNTSRPRTTTARSALAARARQRAGHAHLLQGLRPGRRAGRLGAPARRRWSRCSTASAGRSTSQQRGAGDGAGGGWPTRHFVEHSRQHNRAERARFVAAIEALGNHGLRAAAERGQLRAGAVRGRADRRGRATRPGRARLHRALAARTRACRTALRITIGTAEQMDAIAAALRDMAEARAMTLRTRRHHRPRPARRLDRARGARIPARRAHHRLRQRSRDARRAPPSAGWSTRSARPPPRRCARPTW